MLKPKFIAIEGTADGAGKTTLTNNLKAELEERGIEVVTTFEPGDTNIPELRGILLDPDKPLTAEAELLLFLADRAQHTADIRKALDEGKWVISDRYSLSTVAYQGLRHAFDKNLFWQMCEFAQRDLVPDLTFMLDLPVNLVNTRLSGKKLDRFEQSSPEFFEELRKEYLAMCMGSMFSQRTVILDATESPWGLANFAIREINRFWPEVPGPR